MTTNNFVYSTHLADCLLDAFFDLSFFTAGSGGGGMDGGVILSTGSVFTLFAEGSSPSSNSSSPLQSSNDSSSEDSSPSPFWKSFFFTCFVVVVDVDGESPVKSTSVVEPFNVGLAVSSASRLTSWRFHELPGLLPSTLLSPFPDVVVIVVVADFAEGILQTMFKRMTFQLNPPQFYRIHPTILPTMASNWMVLTQAPPILTPSTSTVDNKRRWKPSVLLTDLL